ncbi:SIMPL domain-containing protein [Candidatus Gottesmanbacteria bacterium]|nr:SIMPL domain-containing protein [Candidatus Gottesmanbacteria bacterium]
MNQLIPAVLLFFVALFTYTKFAGPIPFSITSTTTTKSDTFTVSGEGKVVVVPDSAVVHAGVQTTAGTAKLAQEQLNKAANAVTQAVKKLGIDTTDIKTTNYSVYPITDYQDKQQRITGYQASSSLTIKVRDMDKTNSVIDAATGAGANQVGGVVFEVADKSKAENEAREKAVSEAKKKASDAARIAGFRLGRIVNYSEGYNGAPRPMPIMAKAESADTGVPTQIEPGSSEITVSVTLFYEIL